MKNNDKLTTITWLLNVLSMIACVLTFFFNFTLSNYLILAFCIGIVVFILILIAIALSIALPFFRWKTKGKSTLKPLVFLLVCCCAMSFIDFNSLFFKLKYKEREKVIELVQDGGLPSSFSYASNISLIDLPKQFTTLSLNNGNSVVVQHNGTNYQILFFTFHGILDGGYEGFVYSSNDSAPKKDDLLGGITVVRKIQKNWFYVKEPPF